MGVFRKKMSPVFLKKFVKKVSNRTIFLIFANNFVTGSIYQLWYLFFIPEPTGIMLFNRTPTFPILILINCYGYLATPNF